MCKINSGLNYIKDYWLVNFNEERFKRKRVGGLI